ncbi:MAG: ferritin [Kiritimatiellae bacterium]|nr:ferritin [Kiritimatiellia bacterium]
MISKKMEEAINTQINNEMYSAYLYMAMSTYSDSIGLKGFAKWFMVQYHEEMVHAMKMYEFIQSRGGAVKLGALKKPPQTWKSPTDMFEQTYKHEQFITGCINDLVDLARAEKDKASEIFYQWYVTEQVEEEDNDTTILAQLSLIGDGKNGLRMLDKELGARAVNVPTDFSMGVSAQMKNA